MNTISKLISITTLTLSAAFSVNASAETSIFYNHEFNGPDTIRSLGFGNTSIDPHNHLGFGFSSSFNYANVTTKEYRTEEYFAWEASAKFGYFSQISLYAEAGIDLTELMFGDFRVNVDNTEFHYGDNNSDKVDTFFGIAAGYSMEVLKVELMTRWRNIDSEYWEAESEVFTGISFSLNF